MMLSGGWEKIERMDNQLPVRGVGVRVGLETHEKKSSCKNRTLS